MKNIAIIALSLLSFIAQADNINVHFEFKKKPPKTGIIYAIEETPSGKNDSLDQKNKKFTKRLLITDNEGKITFLNTDSVDHNIFANDAASGASFDIGLMKSGQELVKEVHWESDSIVRLGCKIHPKMKAYVANINSNHFTPIEFTKKQKVYDVQLNNIGEHVQKIGLMLPGYEKITIELKKGQEAAEKLIKKNKERGLVTFSRS